jgi:hypothetical protein
MVDSASSKRAKYEREPVVYRDYCNTCGEPRGNVHADRCRLTGEVVQWSGLPIASDQEQAR